jgi:Tfp pilus assembly protein PilP
MRRAAMVGVLLLAAACGESEKGTAPRGELPGTPHNLPGTPSAAPAAAAAGPGGALQPGADQTKEGLLAEVRKRQLTNEDFKESPSNRDPFRSFLTTFATQVVNVKPQHRILLEKFALEELKLIAIVGGNETAPRAMFVDPTGMGVTVARGDHVSKSDALVSRVAPDRVFFQQEEDTGQGGKPRLSERVIELHAGENIGAQ